MGTNFRYCVASRPLIIFYCNNTVCVEDLKTQLVQRNRHSPAAVYVRCFQKSVPPGGKDCQPWGADIYRVSRNLYSQGASTTGQLALCGSRDWYTSEPQQ